MDRTKTKLFIRTDRNSNNFPNRNIVAGFPGVGKTTAAFRNPELFKDMESSDYHWIYDENGNKSLNPEWPTNYVNAILELANTEYTLGDNTPMYILTSTHKEVLDEFKKLNLYYTAVIPRTKDIYINRYRCRGSSEEFINLLDDKFEEFVKDVQSSSAFGIYYTDEYISDIYTGYTESDPAVFSSHKNAKEFDVSYEFNPNNFPEIYTNKIIIAVWPYADLSVCQAYNPSMFNYCYPDGFMTNIVDDENEEPVIVDNPNWATEYALFANIMANENYINGSYVVIDGRLEVIKALHRMKINYILVLPMSYDVAVKMIGGEACLPKELSDNRTFIAYSMYLQQFAFRTMLTDQPFYEVLCNNLGGLDQASVRAMKYCAYKDTTRLRSKVSDEVGYRWNMIGYETNHDDDSGSHLEYSAPVSCPSKDELIKIAEDMFSNN